MPQQLPPHVMKMFPYLDTLHHAFVDGKNESAFGEVRRFIANEFDFTITDEHLASIMKQGKDGGYYWSNETWRMWIKKRLEGFGYFPCQSFYFKDDWASATLHVFFIHLEETPLMLKRLSKIEPGENKKSKIAASKIFDAAGRVPHPIDRVAHRVAPEPQNNT